MTKVDRPQHGGRFLRGAQGELVEVEDDVQLTVIAAVNELGTGDAAVAEPEPEPDGESAPPPAVDLDLFDVTASQNEPLMEE